MNRDIHYFAFCKVPYNPPYRFCAVVVVRGVSMRTVEDPSQYIEASSSSRPYYITAAWDEESIYAQEVPSFFTVGRGEEFEALTPSRTPGESVSVTYTNVALNSDTSYAIFVRYDIENEDLGGPHEVCLRLNTQCFHHLALTIY